MKRLQNIQNSLARAVIRTPKSSHITPVLKSPHELKINECKLLSLTHKVLTTNQPQYLHNLISVQLCHNTRSFSMVTHLARLCTLGPFSVRLALSFIHLLSTERRGAVPVFNALVRGEPVNSGLRKSF